MNDRFIRKQLYQVGLFYQIDSFNPVYLDKTGQLIAKTEGKLINWNGNIDNFQFTDNELPITGKVNMNNYWYSYSRQGDFDEKIMEQFHKFIVNTNELISDVYKPVHFKRVGLRMQYILKRTAAEAKAKYLRFFSDHFASFKKYGLINTTAIGFDIESNNLNIKVNVSYAKRQTDNDVNAPAEGLLFDIDFYKNLDKIGLAKIGEVNSEVLDFVSDNYRKIIYDIALEIGAVNEA